MARKNHKRFNQWKSDYCGKNYDTRYYYRYHSWKRGEENVVNEKTFRAMLADMFLWLFDNRLMKYKRVKFPKRMGEMIVENARTRFVNIKNEITKVGFIDWKKTRELWKEDYDAKKRSVKVYLDIPTFDKFRYETGSGDFRNARYYDLHLSPKLSRRIFHELTMKDNMTF
jgi:hypothetical protein